MPADRADLAARLAVATDADTVRGLIFQAAFDVAVRHGGEALARACDPAGTGQRSLFHAFPVADLLQLSWSLADHLEGTLGGAEQVFFQIGRQATAQVYGSLVGRTFLALGGEPRTLLNQTPAAYRAMASFGERTVTWAGERHARIQFSGDFLHPQHHRGIFMAALERLAVRTPAVEAQPAGFLATTYDLTWSP
jgi:uncharacterized protein (TIGR02265 family)